MRAKHDLYEAGVQAYLDQDWKQFQKVLKNSDLTQVERALLLVRQHLREDAFIKALDLVKKLTPTNVFLEAEREMLMANVLGYMGRWKEALVHNFEANHLYRSCQDRVGELRTFYNISVDFNRLGDTWMSDEYLRRASGLAQTPREVSLVLRAEACSFSLKSDYENAIKKVDQALTFLPQLNESTAVTLRNVAADIYYRAGQRAKALKQLEELQKNGALRDRDRVAFELGLLRRLEVERPPFSRLESAHVLFPRSDEYQIKWQVLYLLQGGDMEQALAEWERLCAKMPELYVSDFKAATSAEANSIFMTFLNSLRTTVSSVDITGYSRVELLVHLLKHSEFPLRKEYLIEKIWQEPYQPKFDQRLYKLIERAKKSLAVTIANHHFSYSLVNEAETKASKRLG